MKHLKRWLPAVALGIGGLMVAGPVMADGPAGTADDPIVVTDASQIPDDAVKTITTADCVTTTQADWSIVTPGTPAQEGDVVWMYQERTREVVPGEHHDAVTHIEHRYERTVEDSKTQYHFAKFTRTKTKAPDVAGFWQVFSPTYPKTFHGPPSYPTDARGKWSAQKTSGGPGQDQSGVFQQGGGNGSWFYRKQAVTNDWSAFSDWTKWSPETHASWQDSTDPLGSPEFHASGTYKDGTQWYREWQARFDGQTRTVPNGSHTEQSDWMTGEPEGDGWALIAGEGGTRTVVDHEAYDDPNTYTEWSQWADVQESPFTAEPTVPADTDVHQYGNLRSWKATEDVPESPAVTTFYRYVATVGEPCATETPTPQPPIATPTKTPVPPVVYEQAPPRKHAVPATPRSTPQPPSGHLTALPHTGGKPAVMHGTTTDSSGVFYAGLGLMLSGIAGAIAMIRRHNA